MKRSLFGITAVLVLATSSVFANPINISTLPPGALPSGLVTENFQSLPLGSAGGVTPTGMKVTFTPLSGQGQVVNGSVVNEYAAPWVFSSSDPSITTPFGHAAGPDGPDTMNYLTAGVGTVDVKLPYDVTFLGALIGSVDTYNSIDFYHDGNLVAHLTGVDIINIADGNQGPDGTRYVLFDTGPGIVFNDVQFSSNQKALEFGDFAVKKADVPEPASLALMGAGMAGVGFARRKKAA